MPPPMPDVLTQRRTAEIRDLKILPEKKGDGHLLSLLGHPSPDHEPDTWRM